MSGLITAAPIGVVAATSIISGQNLALTGIAVGAYIAAAGGLMLTGAILRTIARKL